MNDTHNSVMPRNKVFIIVPFYKNIHNLSKLYKDFLHPFLNHCKNDEIKESLSHLEVVVSYKTTITLSKYLIYKHKCIMPI